MPGQEAVARRCCMGGRPSLPAGPAARRKELSAGVEHEEEAPIIGRQWFSWGAAVSGDANHPRWLWLCARNYAPSTDVRLLHPHSLPLLLTWFHSSSHHTS